MASTAARLARAKAHIAQAREAAQQQQQAVGVATPVATALAPTTQPVVDANDWATKRQQQMDRANALRADRQNNRGGNSTSLRCCLPHRCISHCLTTNCLWLVGGWLMSQTAFGGPDPYAPVARPQTAAPTPEPFMSARPTTAPPAATNNTWGDLQLSLDLPIIVYN
jgi:hypothetical protein